MSRPHIIGWMTATRPDPDALLDRLQRDEHTAARGRLKIFFGASAGVGKTYAMLAAARRARDEGATSSSASSRRTAARRPRRCSKASRSCRARRSCARPARSRSSISTPRSRASPALLLVDELAHTNAPGSRHPKRWQDVEELLAAGIDVYTTLNVQHLESLNDVVGGITGISVRETVPDTFFDGADEVVLVDLPADELLARLKEGKVYVPAQAERAAQNFFRKGNLIALRELALRRTADARRGRRPGIPRRQGDRAGLEDARARCCAASARATGAEHVVRSAARLAGAAGRGMGRGLRRDAEAAAPARGRARAHPARREAGAGTRRAHRDPHRRRSGRRRSSTTRARRTSPRSSWAAGPRGASGVRAA